MACSAVPDGSDPEEFCSAVIASPLSPGNHSDYPRTESIGGVLGFASQPPALNVLATCGMRGMCSTYWMYWMYRMYCSRKLSGRNPQMKRTLTHR